MLHNRVGVGVTAARKQMIAKLELDLELCPLRAECERIEVRSSISEWRQIRGGDAQFDESGLRHIFDSVLNSLWK